MLEAAALQLSYAVVSWFTWLSSDAAPDGRRIQLRTGFFGVFSSQAWVQLRFVEHTGMASTLIFLSWIWMLPPSLAA